MSEQLSMSLNTGSLDDEFQRLVEWAVATHRQSDGPGRPKLCTCCYRTGTRHSEKCAIGRAERALRERRPGWRAKWTDEVAA